ncbi:MAG: hypothetical protein HY942_08560 [Gammaproteobacteria bacterium]|nr:hypothetical protein [Gammaproteobacteria bacterium]
MNTKSTQCPNCGQPAAGNFCVHCGASLTAPASTRRWNAQTLTPWVAVGVAAVALIVAVVTLVGRGDRAPAPMRLELPLSATAPAPGQPPDLASMTPRDAADRLFNRVMAASERGDSEEALRFAPMALQAYDNLGALDNDAHYHVALIHMAKGDIAGTRVHIDALRKAAPGHLLGIMLEHQLAERGGNQADAGRANKAFLAAYAAEMAAGRTEYQDHQDSIERFHKKAEASVAGKING